MKHISAKFLGLIHRYLVLPDITSFVSVGDVSPGNIHLFNITIINQSTQSLQDASSVRMLFFSKDDHPVFSYALKDPEMEALKRRMSKALEIVELQKLKEFFDKR